MINRKKPIVNRENICHPVEPLFGAFAGKDGSGPATRCWREAISIAVAFRSGDDRRLDVAPDHVPVFGGARFLGGWSPEPIRMSIGPDDDLASGLNGSVSDRPSPAHWIGSDSQFQRPAFAPDARSPSILGAGES